jgi:hypothetical protein
VKAVLQFLAGEISCFPKKKDVKQECDDYHPAQGGQLDLESAHGIKIG